MSKIRSPSRYECLLQHCSYLLTSLLSLPRNSKVIRIINKEEKDPLPFYLKECVALSSLHYSSTQLPTIFPSFNLPSCAPSLSLPPFPNSS